ncbi:MAG: hypothetical protein ACRETH_14540 [Steroidobacteraceae bacterium]
MVSPARPDWWSSAAFCTSPRGWILAPIYDLNPTPTDVRPRILTTNITLDEATCGLELVLSTADTSAWREVAAAAGASQGEIRRMASAFEHSDLSRALAL